MEEDLSDFYPPSDEARRQVIAKETQKIRDKQTRKSTSDVSTTYWRNAPTDPSGNVLSEESSPEASLDSPKEFEFEEERTQQILDEYLKTIQKIHPDYKRREPRPPGPRPPPQPPISSDEDEPRGPPDEPEWSDDDDELAELIRKIKHGDNSLTGVEDPPTSPPLTPPLEPQPDDISYRLRVFAPFGQKKALLNQVQYEVIPNAANAGELVEYIVDFKRNIDTVDEVSSVLEQLLAPVYGNATVEIVIKLRTSLIGNKETWLTVPSIPAYHIGGDHRTNANFRHHIMNTFLGWNNKMTWENYWVGPFDQMYVLVYKFPERPPGKMCQDGDRVSRHATQPWVIASYHARNGECLVNLFCRATGQKNTGNKHSNGSRKWIRENLNVEVSEKGEGVLLQEVGYFAQYFKVRVAVYNDDGIIQYTGGLDSAKDTVNILYDPGANGDAHYLHIVKSSFKPNQKCPACGVTYKQRHTKCDQSRLNFKAGRNGKKVGGWARKESIFSPNHAIAENNIFLDLETFEDPDTAEHIPYAACVGIGKRITFEVEGPATTTKLVDYLISQSSEAEAEEEGIKRVHPTKYVIAYNGSGYDFQFIFAEFLKRGIQPVKWMLKNSSLIVMKFANLVFWDLYLFMPGMSLDRGIESFGLGKDYAKGKFPHKFMTSFASLDYVGDAPGLEYFYESSVPSWNDYKPGAPNWSCRREMWTYLRRDVKGLEELYLTFADVMLKAFSVDVRKFITVSHLSYVVWEEKYVKPNGWVINIPTMETHKKIKKGIFGGRCLPIKQRFSSVFAKGVEEGLFTYDELDSDYLFDMDVVSLYTKCMADFPYPTGLIHHCTVNELKEQELKLRYKQAVKLGYYRVAYKPPKDLVIPSVPNKNFEESKDVVGEVLSKDGLKWDLADGEGWYNSVDIQNMVNDGYEIELKEGFFWTGSAYIFKDFMLECFALKQRGVDEKNEVLTFIAKLIANSLYGKMLQQPNPQAQMIYKSNNQLAQFIAKNKIVDYACSPDSNLILIKGKARTIADKITKPSQLGSFCLGYSRMIMNGYLNKVDPQRRNPNVIAKMDSSPFYTDTDSLIVRIPDENFFQMYIKPHLNKDVLGALWNDLKKDNGKIIGAYFLAPKTYALLVIGKREYKLDDGTKTYGDCMYRVVKAKGLPKYLVKWHHFVNFYEKGITEVKQFRTVKKMGLNHSVVLDRADGENVKGVLAPFSVFTFDGSRTMIKEKWNGRVWKGNAGFPDQFAKRIVESVDAEELERFFDYDALVNQMDMLVPMSDSNSPVSDDVTDNNNV